MTEVIGMFDVQGGCFAGEVIRRGNIGDVTCFSFFPTKNMTVGGDGGMILTKNEEIYKKCFMLRDAGRWDSKARSEIFGYNMRLNEISASIGKEQLKKGKFREYDFKKVKPIILEHAKLAYKDKKDLGIKELRKHLAWYVKGFPDGFLYPWPRRFVGWISPTDHRPIQVNRYRHPDLASGLIFPNMELLIPTAQRFYGGPIVRCTSASLISRFTSHASRTALTRDHRTCITVPGHGKRAHTIVPGWPHRAESGLSPPFTVTRLVSNRKSS
jgi:hypothetical protein